MKGWKCVIIQETQETVWTGSIEKSRILENSLSNHIIIGIGMS